MHEELEKNLKESVEEKINNIVGNGIDMENLDALGKLVDIHKDMSNEKYWKKKEEVMEMNYRGGYGRERYGNDEYGRRGRDSRGRYTGRGRYRGEDSMEEMMELYENYGEAYEEMNRGNYGAEGEMVKSVEGIMKNVYEIVCELSEAETPEVMHIIKKYSKKIEELG